MRPRVVVFDFGNVLAHFSPLRTAEQLAAFSPFPADAVLRRVFGTALEYDLDAGRIAPEAFRLGLRAAIEATGGSDDELDFAFSNMFTRNDALCDTLPDLAARHRLLLLSNTNALHAAHFRQQFRDDLDHFEALVLSHEVGARKPDSPIYRACQERAACPPGDILFVDDRADNVAAARALGWHALHYDPPAGLPGALRALLDAPPP